MSPQPTQRPTTRPLRRPQDLSPALRARRAWLLLVMTVLVPGSAQVVAGSRRLGRVGLRVWLGVLVALLLLGLLALVDRTLVLSLFTRSWVLLLLGALLVAGAALWGLLVLDAWRLARPRLLAARVNRWLAGATVVSLLLTSGALAYAARQVGAGRDLLAGVFGGNTSSAAVDGRFNVLLMGGDAGADRIGVRPDSLTLASIDEETGRTVLFSFPRNLENIPFPAGSPMDRALPGGYDCGDECLLNGVYTYATEHKGIYPPSVRDPGAQATKDAVSAITGLTVNYYVLIDLKGFAALVDAMGGVEVDVQRRVPIGGGTSRVSGYVEPGRQRLDGYHALWLARSRHGSSDYERMARQRCVMTAMLGQMDPKTLLLRFQDIAGASQRVVSTDIAEADLARFVDLGLKAKSQPVTSVQFVPPLIRPARPDFDVVRSTVRTAIERAEVRGPKASEASEDLGSSGASGSGASATSSRAAGTTSGGGPTGDASRSAAAPVDARSVCAPAR